MGGITDWLFGGESVQLNPMRKWAEVGPSATANYYDQAILDSVRQYEQYWSVWDQQMKAVDLMFSGSTMAYDKMFKSGMADLDAQMGDANRQFDTQVEDIRQQEKEGQATLTRKGHSTGLVGTTAVRDWKAGLEDRAEDAVGDIEDRRARASEQVDRARIDLKAQRAAGMAESDRLSGAALIEVLGMAPIGPSPALELSMQKAQQVYGTPWETYAQDIVTKTPGMVTDVLAPAFFSALGSAGAAYLTGGASLLGGLDFGSMFGGGAAASTAADQSMASAQAQRFGWNQFGETPTFGGAGQYDIFGSMIGG